MGIFSNAFEKKWFAIFMFLYVFIMIPFPFFYSPTYIPGPLGVPLFIYTWLIYGLVVIFTVYLFSKAAMRRPEYRQFEEEGGNR